MIEQEIAAGRELDALVADLVFGGPRVREDWYRWFDTRQSLIHQTPVSVYVGPDFSTDIAAAWLVVEKMLDKCYSFAVWDVPSISSVQPGPLVAFKRGVHPPKQEDAQGWGETVPLAICRASLRAIEHTEAGE